MVYTAPTGGGKTLIAELVILQTVIALKMKAVLVVPFVSLVVEKSAYFENLFKHFNRYALAVDRLKVLRLITNALLITMLFLLYR